MKVSLITACFRSAKVIRTALESVLGQRDVEFEYLVVDGGSDDGTVAIIKEYEPKFGGRMRWLSERDKGMYDAINKGIRMATGDVVGILNADDVLADDRTLAQIAGCFSHKERKEGEEKVVGANNSQLLTHNSQLCIDCVYADIRFVKGGDTVEELRGANTVRYCSAAKWRPWMFRFAAMVPHPSFYVRKECFERLGGYSLDYRICSDFELELRFLKIAGLKAAYLPKCVVVMRTGGASTAGWRANVEINREDLKALRAHGVWSCLPMIYLKYLFKIWGFVFKKV